MMDSVEELRLALVAGDLEKAKTLIGPVWNEMDGLRRLAGMGEANTPDPRGRPGYAAAISTCDGLAVLRDFVGSVATARLSTIGESRVYSAQVDQRAVSRAQHALAALGGVESRPAQGPPGQDDESVRSAHAKATEALEKVYPGGCREWDDEKCNYCYERSEFVLWGKLLPTEALGPRCYTHAAKHVHHSMLYPGANGAIIDLRPVNAVLVAAEAAKGADR